MARGINLATLRSELKAEIGQSQNQGTFNDAALNTMLSNRQRWLASEFDWPFLEARYDVALPGLSRYVVFPLVDTNRPIYAEVFWNNNYQPVEYGVSSIEYNYRNSDQTQTQDPVQRWRFADQIEIFPPAAPSAADGGTGLLLGGVYQWVVTFVTSYGETTAGAAVSFTNTVSHQVALSNIPIGQQVQLETVLIPSPIIARKIYRTAVGGSTFFLVGTINDNTTTTFADNTPDTSLGVVSPPTSSTAETTVFEVWPMTQTLQTVRFTGQRLLSPLVLDSDTADLDDLLIVWSTALNSQLRFKLADSQLTATQFQQRLTKLRSSLPVRTRKCRIAGEELEKDSGRLQRVVPIVAVHG